MHRYIFGGGGEIFYWGVFQGEIFHGEGNFKNVYTTFFLYVLLSLFRLNFTHRVVNSKCQGYIFTGNELSRSYFNGEGVSSVDVGSDFLALFEKRSEIK